MKTSVSAFAFLAAVAACSSGGDSTAPGASVTPPGAGFACPVSEVMSLTVGEVRTALPGAQVCIANDAAGEYMLTGFNPSLVTSGKTPTTITAFGATTVSTSQALGSLAANGDLVGLDGMT